jgi:uncharacterized protein YqgQ
MIKLILENFFLKHKRLSIEHKDSIYAIYASCDKLINKQKNIYKHQGYCHRAAYYSCNGIGEKDRLLNHSLSSKMGDSVENMLLWMFKEEGILFDKAVKFKLEEYNVSGKLDAILLIDGEKVGIEIKSLSSNQWTINKIFGTKWNIAFPKLDHLLQCIIYLYAFKDEIDTFKLFYIRRDNCDTKEFKIQLALIDNILYPVIDGIPYYDINCNNILDKFKILNELVSNDELPPRSFSIEYTEQEIKELFESKFISKYMYEKYNECKFGDYECYNCSYKDLCLKDGE